MVVNYDGVKSEYFYSLNSGRLNFVDENDSDIDLINNFIIRNRNKKENDGKLNCITTSFYLAVKLKPGLIIGTQLGDYVINKDDNNLVILRLKRIIRILKKLQKSNQYFKA